MEIELQLNKDFKKSKDNECRILWAEDDIVMQKTIPKLFLQVINEDKSTITNLLNIQFEKAKLDIEKNLINLHNNEDKTVYSFYLDLATNGKDAIKKFHEDPSKYHFLLFDEMMPLVKGSEAIAVIRDKYPNILIISWSTIKNIKDEIIKAGANIFFDKTNPKPIIKEILKYALSEKKKEDPENKSQSSEKNKVNVQITP